METEIYECVPFGAAWLNASGLLGLGGGMRSTDEQSSSILFLKQRQSYLDQTFGEKDLYGFLQDGQQASMMDTYSPLQQWQHMLHLRNKGVDM